MTERKPPEISFTSWVDQQINEAAERGAFDNLPGTGKPLPDHGEPDDGQAWLPGYLRKVGPPIFLPPANKGMLASRWRDAHAESRPAAMDDRAGRTEEPARPRWWHR